jgi:POT family proton-dependent oligopeptide transporter
MVGQLYAEDDPRRDAGFTMFYMGINLGAFLAAIVCGWLAQEMGWRWGFGAAGVGMVAGLAMYLWGRDRWLPGIGLPTTPAAKAAAGPATAGDWRRVTALVIVVLFVVAFWLGFEQTGSSMNLFADRHTDRTLGGFQIPTAWFQAVNSFAILLFAPVFAYLWARLQRAGREPSTPAKMVAGLGLLAAGFAVLAVGGYASDRGALVSPAWLLAAYLLHTWGELCLSPVGLSYVTKVAPARFASVLMATWFLSNAAGNKLSGSLAAVGDGMGNGPFFLLFVGICGGAAVLLAFLVPVINRLIDGAPSAPPTVRKPELATP